MTRKFLLFFLALAPPVCGMSQPAYGDFRIVNTEIIYQKVFDQPSVTLEKVDSLLKASPGITEVSMSGESLTATLTDMVVDYKKFKFPQVTTPPIIQTGRFSGKLTAEAKDGRYRITLEQITMKGDIGYKNIPEPEPMTNYACMKGATILSKDWCRPNMLGVLNQALNDLFAYKVETKSSDW